MTTSDPAAADVPPVPYRNEHFAYPELSKRDRHALRDLLKQAFPIGKSSHELWSEFSDTTAFVRRIVHPGPADPEAGIIGAAIVMSYPQDQYDYLAYLAVHPDYRRRWRLFPRGDAPHHGTSLLHEIYDVMRDRVSPERMQRSLMIEPAGDAALAFYLRALPTNEYPLQYCESERIISVAYDGFAL